jgi:hypothetical protein
MTQIYILRMAPAHQYVHREAHQYIDQKALHINICLII